MSKKFDIYIAVERYAVFEIASPSEGDKPKLYAVSPECNVYIVQRCRSIAGRYHQINHAVLIATQALGFRAGLLVSQVDTTKKKSKKQKELEVEMRKLL